MTFVNITSFSPIFLYKYSVITSLLPLCNTKQSNSSKKIILARCGVTDWLGHDNGRKAERRNNGQRAAVRQQSRWRLGDRVDRG